MADPKSLYEHAHDIEYAMSAAIDRETGELTDESMSEHLDELLALGEDKILAVALYQQGLLREAEMVKVEVARLTLRQKLHERQAAKLLEYLTHHAPRIVGRETVKNHLVTVAWRKTPPRVEIEIEASELPTEFQRISIAPDKSAIKDALKGGTDVAGCKLVQEERLVIK